jgi:hypothetical protein
MAQQWRQPGTCLKKLKEDQRHILIHVQQSIVGAVPGTTGAMEIFQQAGDGFEILKALQILFLDLFSLGAHNPH